MKADSPPYDVEKHEADRRLFAREMQERHETDQRNNCTSSALITGRRNGSTRFRHARVGCNLAAT